MYWESSSSESERQWRRENNKRTTKLTRPTESRLGPVCRLDHHLCSGLSRDVGYFSATLRAVSVLLQQRFLLSDQLSLKSGRPWQSEPQAKLLHCATGGFLRTRFPPEVHMPFCGHGEAPSVPNRFESSRISILAASGFAAIVRVGLSTDPRPHQETKTNLPE